MDDRIELRLEATAEGIDWVRSLLATIGYAGEIDIRPTEGESWPYRVRLYPAQGFEVDRIASTLYSLERTKLTSALKAFNVDEVTIAASPTTSIGRFTIQPPDRKPAETDQITLQIGSTLAFGSGLHPATIVSLKLLDRHLSPSMQTLDLGSGSGILSVAMAKLGADVMAIDNDPIAVQATESTVKLNGVESQVQTLQGSLGQGSEFGHWMNGSSFGSVAAIRPIAQFDLIVANILAHLHLTLATDYQQALKPKGILITAGYTIDRAEEIDAALQAVGFEAIDREMLDDWIAIAHRLQFI
ncbi:50S ribosomal protein L11 methyltransferase [Microcoleus sp. FACHB-1515]|uniref:50S ribosomal protein L11 methyltransferase n=1 Tax=Cyanophyceae TaxID=3028117 RepID=UPI001684BD6E|nr:50S ribosomal protein L11 methyltransferase [Microcoleus sp. FACHB-1515]MBD2089034.1 50S ribosomal protein L11 methyltransferase [Microcoleus sp. FACHB-1515]